MGLPWKVVGLFKVGLFSSVIAIFAWLIEGKKQSHQPPLDNDKIKSMAVGLAELYCQYSFKEGNMLQRAGRFTGVFFFFLIFFLISAFGLLWFGWGFPFLFEEERGYDFGG